MIYNVAIAGAGPSGATLAYKLASSGISVIIFEKYLLPRYKSCAGGITLKTKKLLDSLIPDEFYDCAINKSIISYQSNLSIEKESKKNICWTVKRPEFDYLLVSYAEECGAILHEKEAILNFTVQNDFVEIQTTKEIFKAEILVGADGVNSIVARKSGLASNIEKGISWETEIKVPQKILERFKDVITMDFGDFPYGYSWIFPKKDCFSVGIFSQKLDIPDFKNNLISFINKQYMLKNQSDISLKAHLIPLGGKKYPLTKERVLLIGDAGGLVDPYLGEGIYYALKSADFAFETIKKYFKKESDLKEYENKVFEEITLDLAHARMISSLTYYWPRLSFNLFIRFDTFSDVIFGLIKGELRYSQLLTYLRPFIKT